MHERPLSPHLQVYRLPLTAWLSITHRMAGVVLLAGLIGLALGLMSAAQGPRAYAGVQQVLQSYPGRLLVWLWVVALLLHFCHGIRHLVWDAGFGFRKDRLRRHAMLELAATVALAGAVYYLS